MGTTYWRQLVNPWQHTSPVQSAESLAHPVHVRYSSWENKFDIKESDGNMFNSILQTMSRDRNIPETEQLQNQISLYARNYGRPIWMIRYFYSKQTNLLMMRFEELWYIINPSLMLERYLSTTTIDYAICKSCSIGQLSRGDIFKRSDMFWWSMQH